MGVGHRGPSNRFAWLREKAFELAFLIASVSPELAVAETDATETGAAETGAAETGSAEAAT
jgi:hypothetical protein